MRGTLVTLRILQYRKVILLAKRWKRDLLFCGKYFSPFASKRGLGESAREREKEGQKRESERGGQRRVKKRVERGKCTQSRDEKSFVDLAEI